MSGILLIVFAIATYAMAYNTYGRFLSRKFSIDNSKPTPSHTQRDGVDYFPAKPPVLPGHHFASIAGAGPIIGPVIAVGFGWLPVYIWVLAGAVFIGGVHDFTSMTLWPVFGTANQLLASLALPAITVWAANLNLNYLFTLLPMLFMFAVTLSALAMLCYNNLFFQINYILAFISLVLFALAVLLGIKSYQVLSNKKLEHSLQQN